MCAAVRKIRKTRKASQADKTRKMDDHEENGEHSPESTAPEVRVASVGQSTRVLDLLSEM
jgi:hypothetical protein